MKSTLAAIAVAGGFAIALPIEAPAQIQMPYQCTRVIGVSVTGSWMKTPPDPLKPAFMHVRPADLWEYVTPSGRFRWNNREFAGWSQSPAEPCVGPDGFPVPGPVRVVIQIANEPRTVEGDRNGDGIVDGLDADIYAAAGGADHNGDGVIDTLDVLRQAVLDLKPMIQAAVNNAFLNWPTTLGVVLVPLTGGTAGGVDGVICSLSSDPSVDVISTINYPVFVDLAHEIANNDPRVTVGPWQQFVAPCPDFGDEPGHLLQGRGNELGERVAFAFDDGPFSDGAAPPPPPGDRDGDGVLDDADVCPDVPNASQEVDPATGLGYACNCF